MIAIRADDLRGPEIAALLQLHLDGMRAISPEKSVHALDLAALRAPDISFWTAWDGAALAGCGALRELEPNHGEIKSMRTHPDHLRKGVGEAILRHILGEARMRGYARLSLETGRPAPFGPAQRLYARHGFAECPPFGNYRPDPFSMCMSLAL